LAQKVSISVNWHKATAIQRHQFWYQWKAYATSYMWIIETYCILHCFWDMAVLLLISQCCIDHYVQIFVIWHVTLQSAPPVRELVIPTVNVISQSRAAFSSALSQQPASSSSVTAHQQTRYCCNAVLLFLDVDCSKDCHLQYLYVCISTQCFIITGPLAFSGIT